ncbi:hypothetical protein R4Y45_06085 [Holzapfeliella sp. He02]|uniref:HK97 gp10 family phage protein n=1 Tax=Holzapfeliella saturejae TaxID=3082953 RepID=A0ABU8SHC3_9LACO
MADKILKVDFEGLPEFTEALLKAQKGSQIKKIVRERTSKLDEQTQRNMISQYKGHWERGKFVKPTGTTRRSVTNAITQDGFTGTVGVGTHYFPYLELGTRFMHARPTLTPAFNQQQQLFIRDIRELIK